MDNEISSVRYSNSQREARQHRNAHRASQPSQYPSRTSHSQRSANSHTSPRRPQQSANPTASQPARQNNHYDEESNNEMHLDPNARPTVRDHFVAGSGEFVGTFMFLYFSFTIHIMAATRAVTTSDDTATQGANSQTVVFISLGYGFSLLVCAWVWYRVSGGLFNPAVSAVV
jgi:hypothetical protein